MKRRCSVCGVYKPLTASGTIKLHGLEVHHKRERVYGGRRRRRTSGTCAHRARAWPSELAPTRQSAWPSAPPAAAAIRRRSSRLACDELGNLITLCSDCHAEWTFCQPPTVSFDDWRNLPPARALVEIFAKPWPADITAAAYRDHVLLSFAISTTKRGEKRDG